MSSIILNLGQPLTFSHARPFDFRIIRIFSLLHSNIRDVTLKVQYVLDNTPSPMPQHYNILLGTLMGSSLNNFEVDLYQGFNEILTISILFEFNPMDVDLPITIVYEDLSDVTG